MTRSLTAVLIREDDGFVALCPEADVASQGDSVEDAKKNLREAGELFFECASLQEIEERLAATEDRAEVETAWDTEIATRVERIRQGTAQGRPAEDVFRDLRARCQ